MKLWKRKQNGARPDRIRLSVLEPPCRCREPLIDEAAKARVHEVVIDIRGLEHEEQHGPVFRAVDRLHDDERLRVQADAVSWPLLSFLLWSGERFQIVRRTPGRIEIVVWRFYDEDQRRRYLRQTVDGRCGERPRQGT